jgi:hypothetical protein
MITIQKHRKYYTINFFPPRGRHKPRRILVPSYEEALVAVEHDLSPQPHEPPHDDCPICQYIKAKNLKIKPSRRKSPWSERSRKESPVT